MSVVHNLEAWWHAIWHHFVHGTLPPAPTVGGSPATLNPPAPTVTPPAPVLPTVAPQHVDQATQNTPVNAIPSAPTPATAAPEQTTTTAPAATPEPAPAAPVGVQAGDVVHPGVKLVDATNGLVQIDAADAAFPGQLFACAPLLAALNPHSQAYATVAYNTAYGRSADAGLGMHLRVNTMVAGGDDAIAPEYKNSAPYVWIDHAWTIGAEFDTWDKAIEHAVFIAGDLAKNAANTGSTGHGGFGH